MRRLLTRGVGVVGVISGFVFPVAYTAEGPDQTAGDALLGRVDAPGYVLTDVSWIAVVTVLACTVLLATAVREPQTGRQESIEAWATLVAGGIALLSTPALLGSVGFDPSASSSLPGPALFPALVGGVMTLGSALWSFYQAVDPRRRDVLAVGSFVVALLSLPFPLYTAGDGRWEGDEDVNTYTIDPNSGAEVPEGPPTYTGTELDLVLPVAAVFAVFFAAVVARHRRDSDRFTIAGLQIPTDAALGAIVFSVFGLYTLKTRGTQAGQVEWELHGTLLQYSMITCLGTYVAWTVYRPLGRRFGSSSGEHSETAGGNHPVQTRRPSGSESLGARLRRALPRTTPAVTDYRRAVEPLPASTVGFVTDAGGVVAVRATDRAGGCALGFHPQRDEWVVVATTDDTTGGDQRYLDDEIRSWCQEAYPRFRIRRTDSTGTNGRSGPPGGTRGPSP